MTEPNLGLQNKPLSDYSLILFWLEMCVSAQTHKTNFHFCRHCRCNTSFSQTEALNWFPHFSVMLPVKEQILDKCQGLDLVSFTSSRWTACSCRLAGEALTGLDLVGKRSIFSSVFFFVCPWMTQRTGIYFSYRMQRLSYSFLCLQLEPLIIYSLPPQKCRFIKRHWGVHSLKQTDGFLGVIH